MSIFDSIYDNIAYRIANILTSRGESVLKARSYREGKQPAQLKVNTAKGQFDDNLVVNFTGLVEDRTISQMFGTGIKLDFEGDDKIKSPQEEYIEKLLKANSWQKLLHNAKQYAGDAGTGFFKLKENGVVGEDGLEYTRIIPVDPAFVTIETDKEDVDIVTKYVIKYVVMDENDKSVIKKQEIARTGTGWTVTMSESKNDGKSYVIIEDPESFSYCPMIHWQNLPYPGTQEGEPDIKATDRQLQNRLNFVISNASKIIRRYAHPKSYLIGGSISKNTEGVIDDSPDAMIMISGDDKTKFGQIEPLGDLDAVMDFIKFLKQCYFDITRTVDIDSLEDKLGDLTNFALRVIYQDNESKINTMRLMMGEAIVQLVMRCQMIAGMQPLSCEVVWPEFIPVNPTEQTQTLVEQKAAGFVDNETAILELGRDPQAVKERLEAEKANSQALGGDMIRQFLAGK